MKLIMENWREYQEKVLLQEQQVETLEDLVATINAIMAIKNGERLAGSVLDVVKSLVGADTAAKFISKTGEVVKEPNKIIDALGKGLGMVGAAVDIITGAQSVGDVIKTAAALPDSERSKAGYLQMFDIDDEYLEILDDKLDNDLIKYLLQRAQKAIADGTDIGDFDVNRVFEEFIQTMFKRNISGAGEKKAADVAKQTKASVAKKRLGGRIAGAAGQVARAAKGAARAVGFGGVADVASTPRGSEK